MNKKLETIKSYNKGAKILARKFNEIGPRTKDVEQGISFTNKKNPKVLEIGCGNGRDAKEILKFTNDYIGVDISEKMINLAKEYTSEGRFQTADIEEYEFPQNVDIIFAFASLLHFDKKSLNKIFNKAYDSLSNNGIFYISLKFGTHQEKVKIDEFGSRFFYLYTEKDIKELIKDKYNILLTNKQNLKGVEWLTIVLKKI